MSRPGRNLDQTYPRNHSGNRRLIVKHTSRTVKAIVTDMHYRIDVNTLHRDESAAQLGLNEVGRVRLRLTQPVFCDPCARNRTTGGLILIDESTNATVGVAMITRSGIGQNLTL